MHSCPVSHSPYLVLARAQKKQVGEGWREGGREGGFRLRLETCVVAHRELLHLDVVWLEEWKRRFPCSCIIDPLAE